MGDERSVRRRRVVDGGALDEDENGRTSSAELAQRDVWELVDEGFG